MAFQSISINDTPIEEFNLVLVGGSPSVSGLNRQRDVLVMPGRAGGLVASTSSIAPKVFRFELLTNQGIITSAARQAVLDQLRDLFEGSVELKFATSATRKISGVCQVFEGQAYSPTFVNIATTIVVEIVCENGAFMDVEPTQLVLSATPARVSVGTVGHDGRFYVTGSNSTPFTITYRDAAGVLWGQLNVTPALASGERMIIDLASQQIAKVDSSDNRTLQPTWDTGSNWFHVLPRDCNRELSAWPTLESNVGVLYESRRNWEH